MRTRAARLGVWLLVMLAAPAAAVPPSYCRQRLTGVLQSDTRGQIRIRVRYKDLAGPWFDYLFVSPDELAELLEGTAWRIERIVRGETSYFVAVLA